MPVLAVLPTIALACEVVIPLPEALAYKANGTLINWLTPEIE